MSAAAPAFGGPPDSVLAVGVDFVHLRWPHATPPTVTCNGRPINTVGRRGLGLLVHGLTPGTSHRLHVADGYSEPLDVSVTTGTVDGAAVPLFQVDMTSDPDPESDDPTPQCVVRVSGPPPLRPAQQCLSIGTNIVVLPDTDGVLRDLRSHGASAASAQLAATMLLYNTETTDATQVHQLRGHVNRVLRECRGRVVVVSAHVSIMCSEPEPDAPEDLQRAPDDIRRALRSLGGSAAAVNQLEFGDAYVLAAYLPKDAGSPPVALFEQRRQRRIDAVLPSTLFRFARWYSVKEA